ncbi:MAG: penicillin-binding protein 2 [Synechococcus sp. MED-G71]|nr:MAG: penicillin-binding protein 2 [Synechococcus sp. MED-G71]|tara:strand:- start:36085 stop:37872 length:1788 start_codon:yes stop_codon:yes gene_type:complete
MPTAKRGRTLRGTRRTQRVLQLHPVPASRLITVMVLLALALGGLGLRLAWLQLIEGTRLEARARRVQTETRTPLGRRRTIVDRRGRLLAIDEERVTVWAHPRYFRFPGDQASTRRSTAEVAAKLAPLLGVPASELVQRMGQHRSGVRLSSNVEPSLATRLRALGIDGIDFEHGPQRVYPQGSLFANVLGFLNLERVPQAGLELSLNQRLQSQEHALGIRKGGDGTPLPDGIGAGRMHRDDLRLQLTLDTRLQRVAQLELARQVQQWSAKRGAALVMDARNGELLALASVPTYDPNEFWEFSPGLFREWSVQDLYEPGSTLKPINLAIALQEKALTPASTVVDKGSLVISGWPIYNHDKVAHGTVGLAKVLQVSSNVGMVRAMQRLKAERYWEWLERLGVGSAPDTDLPGAVSGQLKSRSVFTGNPIEPATAAFGQGLALTPLKLLQLHAMLSNGGHLVSPHITRGLRSGDDLAGPGPTHRQPLLDPAVSSQVLAWLESVVQQGSGQQARIAGYRIGGKTGTAQKAANGVYIPGALITSFVAHLPIDEPRYVVLVVVDEPQGENAYGSTVAAPVAKSIMEALLVIERIPPSRKQRN